MGATRTIPCPACGKDIPVKAKACHHCGACDKSGWKEDTADGLDLPDEDFDYEKFVAEEFGTPRKSTGMKLVWKVTGIALLVLAVLGYLMMSFNFH